MARVTVTELKVLIPTTTLTDPQLQLAIDTASTLVDMIAVGCAGGLTDDQLRNVELYLSAHIASMSDPQLVVSEQKFEGSSTKYSNTSKLGSGVLSTTYGTTANMLSGGCLQKLDKRKPTLASVGV